MGRGLATTASGRRGDDASSSSSQYITPHDSHPSCSEPLSLPYPPSGLRVIEIIKHTDSASPADKLAVTADLITSSHIALASSPRDLKPAEPIILPNHGDKGSVLASVVDQSLPASVRTARRLQQQLNAQLQVTRSQLESISVEVDELVVSEEQNKMAARLAAAGSPQREPVEMNESPDMDISLDEGFCEGGDDGDEMAVERLRLTFRKANDHRGVRKNVGGKEILIPRARIRRKITRRRRPEGRPMV